MIFSLALVGTCQEVEFLRTDINKLTKKVRFTLRKWSSKDELLVKQGGSHPRTTDMAMDPKAIVNAF